MSVLTDSGLSTQEVLPNDTTPPISGPPNRFLRVRKSEAATGDTPTQEVPTLTPRILNSARARLILEDAVCRSFPLAMTLTSRES